VLHALGRTAQALHQPGLGLGLQAGREQGPGDHLGGVRVVQQDGQLVPAQGLAHDGLERPAVRRQHRRVLPGFAQAGKRQLDRSQARIDGDALAAQAAGQGGGDAEEDRVARRQDHHPTPSLGQTRDVLGQGLGVGAEDDPLGRMLGLLD
jgi:hypothetical protein